MRKHINPILIDVNKASASEFAQLNGIGPVLSKRIIRFRESQKGFKSIDDLSKVYGLSPETFQKIRPHLKYSPREKTIIKEVEELDVKEEIVYQSSEIQVDINKADSLRFSQLTGVSPSVAGTIVKFREMIGGFDSLEHLIKVYGIDDRLFDKIQPSLVISEYESKESVQNEIVSISIKESFDFDINTVSAEELERIKGIGPYYANEIVELRSKLGGYAEISQLKSLYKMDSITYLALINNCTIKTSHQKFDINEVEFKELLGMKILSFEEVKYVFNLKKSLGVITSADQLKQLQGIPESKMNLLLLYLNFED